MKNVNLFLFYPLQLSAWRLNRAEHLLYIQSTVQHDILLKTSLLVFSLGQFTSGKAYIKIQCTLLMLGAQYVELKAC